MIAILAVLLAAQQPTATPTPQPLSTPAPISILRDAGSAEAIPRGQSLGDVAKGIKLRMTPGARVIDNAGMKALAEGVELTTAKPAPGAGGKAAEGRPPAKRVSDESKQQYWQEKYQSARARVAFLESEVKRLDGLTKELERKFYAWDDPAYRDGVIKPAWDKAVVDLRASMEALDEARSGPDQVIEDAQRDGALPGWFRGLPEPSAADLKPAGTPRPAVPTFPPDY
jgi:hypothetical protein